MPNIKLTYFDTAGRAEVIRLLLAQAGVEFEDCRINKEAWNSLKKTVPFGQLPALEYDGVTMTQSVAILRFLAREYNLAGKNNLETAQADMYQDCLTDIFNKFLPLMFESDDEKKAAGKKIFIEEHLPSFLNNMEGALKKNGGKYLVGDALTYVDIHFAYGITNLAKHFEGWKLQDTHPVLATFAESIMALPNIKAWREK